LPGFMTAMPCLCTPLCSFPTPGRAVQSQQCTGWSLLTGSSWSFSIE
jgi:hypothetical protein